MRIKILERFVFIKLQSYLKNIRLIGEKDERKIFRDKLVIRYS